MAAPNDPQYVLASAYSTDPNTGLPNQRVLMTTPSQGNVGTYGNLNLGVGPGSNYTINLASTLGSLAQIQSGGGVLFRSNTNNTWGVGLIGSPNQTLNITTPGSGSPGLNIDVISNSSPQNFYVQANSSTVYEATQLTFLNGSNTTVSASQPGGTTGPVYVTVTATGSAGSVTTINSPNNSILVTGGAPTVGVQVATVLPSSYTIQGSLTLGVGNPQSACGLTIYGRTSTGYSIDMGPTGNNTGPFNMGNNGIIGLQQITNQVADGSGGTGTTGWLGFDVPSQSGQWTIGSPGSGALSGLACVGSGAINGGAAGWIPGITSTVPASAGYIPYSSGTTGQFALLAPSGTNTVLTWNGSALVWGSDSSIPAASAANLVLISGASPGFDPVWTGTAPTASGQVLTYNGTSLIWQAGSASDVDSVSQGVDTSIVVGGTGSGGGPYTGAVTVALNATIPNARSFTGLVTLSGGGVAAGSFILGSGPSSGAGLYQYNSASALLCDSNQTVLSTVSGIPYMCAGGISTSASNWIPLMTGTWSAPSAVGQVPYQTTAGNFALSSAPPSGSATVLSSNGSGIISWTTDSGSGVPYTETPATNLQVGNATSLGSGSVQNTILSTVNFSNLTGGYNVFIVSPEGSGASGYQAATTAHHNTVIGDISGNNLTTGGLNTLIGQNCGGSNSGVPGGSSVSYLTTGNNNTWIGNTIGFSGGSTPWGSNHQPTNCIAIGQAIGFNDGTSSGPNNVIVFGNNIQLAANTNNAVILGQGGANTDMFVGINTVSPAYSLHIGSNGAGTPPTLFIASSATAFTTATNGMAFSCNNGVAQVAASATNGGAPLGIVGLATAPSAGSIMYSGGGYEFVSLASPTTGTFPQVLSVAASGGNPAWIEFAPDGVQTITGGSAGAAQTGSSGLVIGGTSSAVTLATAIVQQFVATSTGGTDNNFVLGIAPVSSIDENPVSATMQGVYIFGDNCTIPGSSVPALINSIGIGAQVQLVQDHTCVIGTTAYAANGGGEDAIDFSLGVGQSQPQGNLHLGKNPNLSTPTTIYFDGSPLSTTSGLTVPSNGYILGCSGANGVPWVKTAWMNSGNSVAGLIGTRTLAIATMGTLLVANGSVAGSTVTSQNTFDYLVPPTSQSATYNLQFRTDSNGNPSTINATNGLAWVTAVAETAVYKYGALAPSASPITLQSARAYIAPYNDAVMDHIYHLVLPSSPTLGEQIIVLNMNSLAGENNEVRVTCDSSSEITWYADFIFSTGYASIPNLGNQLTFLCITGGSSAEWTIINAQGGNNALVHP